MTAPAEVSTSPSSFSLAPNGSSPAAHGPRLDLPAATAVAAGALAGRILLVDDSRMMRAILAKFLANVGYTDVVMAESGTEALAMLGLGDERPDAAIDAILMDLVLPDIDGIEAIRRIKAEPRLHDVPVLMVTAEKDVAILRTAFEAGASDYLTKPINEIDLSARLGAALRLKREIDRRVALTQQLEEANRRLQQLSRTDGLTGVANRRHFDNALDEEWRRAARSGSPLALLLIDIDHFKRYNDTYGHQEGDQCLQLVAGALARCAARPGDLAARYCGEEFALILPNTDQDGACRVAARLRAEVAALAIPHAASSAGPLVTLSVGVAVGLSAGGGGPQALIAAADRALYAAKEQGRDRVVAAE